MKIYDPRNEKNEALATVAEVGEVNAKVLAIEPLANGAVQDIGTVTQDTTHGLNFALTKEYSSQPNISASATISPATLSNNQFSTTETKVATAGDVQKAIDAARAKIGTETVTPVNGVVTVQATGFTNVQITSIRDSNGEYWEGVRNGSKSVRLWASGETPRGTEGLSFTVTYFAI